MATNSSNETIFTPQHLRFECSGCGNCCLQWPVPATDADVERIGGLVPSPASVSAGDSSDMDKALYAFLRRYQSGVGGFRPLSVGDQRFRGFTHVLEKRSDGKCQFLTEDNSCSLHAEHGAESKPAMCRLFPHSFSITPGGVYAYVSFASSGVLFNHGKLLSEQSDLLASRYELYRQLFPQSNPDWSLLQILDGHSLRWKEFAEIDEQIINIMLSNVGTDVLGKLRQCSRVAREALPRRADPEKLPDLGAPPELIDRVLLKHLRLAYLPDDVFNDTELEFPLQGLMKDIVAPTAVSLGSIQFDELAKFRLQKWNDDCENLLWRYAYARLFSKLYLGPNLGHLSLISGLHHLFFAIALIRLEAKRIAVEKGEVPFLQLAEVVRTVERRLSQMNYSPQAGAAMEVLFSSPSRLDRVSELVS